MRFRKGGRYRRSEVEGLPTTPIILCVVVLVLVWRSYVTRLFEVDTDFKNIFTLKCEREIRCCYYELGLWKGNSSTPVNRQGPEANRADDKHA